MKVHTLQKSQTNAYVQGKDDGWWGGRVGRESFCGRDSEGLASLTEGQVPPFLIRSCWVTFVGSLSIAGSASMNKVEIQKVRASPIFLQNITRTQQAHAVQMI